MTFLLQVAPFLSRVHFVVQSFLESFDVVALLQQVPHFHYFQFLGHPSLFRQFLRFLYLFLEFMPPSLVQVF